MKRIIFAAGLLITVISDAWSQAGAGMKLGPKHEAYVDSIKKSDYIWTFPILGKKLSKRGFDLQYPYGLMLNPYVGSQLINISDLEVGINGGQQVPLDFVKFGEVKGIARSVTVRPDIWILPFLDVYGILGATWTETHVQVTAPIQFNTQANFNGSTFGLGTTIAGGYHGFIFIMDINHTWTTLSSIEGSIQGTMITPRLGMNFLFKKRPDQNIAFWVGAPGFFVNRTTNGTVDLSSLGGGGGSKGDLEGIVNETADWYQSLSPAQKIVVKAIAQAFLNKIDGIDIKGATINYSLNKKPTSNWSMCIGGQFQLNHHWQFRSEVGMLGGRSSVLISANYRWRGKLFK